MSPLDEEPLDADLPGADEADDETDAPPALITHIFRVENECDGWRLDRFLQKRIKRLSRARIQRVIHGDCQVEGRPAKPSMTVYTGQEVRFTRPAPPEPEVPRQVGILYQDEDLYALDKPAGLPIHPSARYHHSTLTAVLRELFPAEKLQVGHRLDRETSGVLLVARTAQAGSAIKTAFAKRRMEKSYLALCRGWVAEDDQVIDAPIGPDGGLVRVRMAVRSITEGGLPARTQVRVLKRLPGDGKSGPVTLVECRPHTGRQHQIRVHLWHIGHPIMADKLYPDEALFIRWADDGDDAVRDELPLLRHALHAAALRFPHPRSGEMITVESPLPADLQGYLSGLQGRDDGAHMTAVSDGEVTS